MYISVLAEFYKIRHAQIRWVTFIAFSLAPIMGGVFMLIMKDDSAFARAGVLSSKAQLMDFSADWNSFFNILSQAMGVGGILIFGFVASWLFGREYSDGTSKDLLSLPTSRTSILNAKFIIYSIWCLLLALFNLMLGLLIGFLVDIGNLELARLFNFLPSYGFTTVLSIILGFPVALLALIGKGYLVPLGFVALTLVFAQIIAATGYGAYFPWSVPGLYSGAGGEYKEQLNELSYGILFFTAFLGYLLTTFYWKYTDQIK